MFNKTFGTSSFGTGSTFGTSTPFGQTATSTFGQRPATTNVFGASTFGAPQATATVFGAPQTSTNLFGFGQQAAATGMQQQQQPAGFFGNPGQTATSTPLFGATPTSTSNFNMSRPTFGGFGASTNLFGAQPQTQATPLFGQTAAAPGTSTFFGAGFGSAASAPTGTTIKFTPPTGTDTMVKNGTNQNIHTRHQCITSMKEYENKSLEELRLEDYAANRKGSGVMPFSSTTGATQPGLFNQPSTSGFSFGASAAPKPLFGVTTQANTMTGFGAQNTTPMFGSAATGQANPFNKTTPFGSTATSTGSFSFGNPVATSTTGSLFGANPMQQKSMFGATPSTGMFGATSTTTTAPAFGTTGTMFGNPGTFGAAANSNPFGVRPTTFGATSSAAPTTGFGFGAAAPTQSTSLFGQPRPTGSTFGTPSFGTTGFGGFQNTQSTGLFGQQPKPTTFGTTPFGSTGTTAFGTGTTGFSGFGANTSTAPSLFSNTQANKSAFSFNNPSSFSFGGPTLGGANNPLASQVPQLMDQAALAAVQAQIQQHVMALNSLPYGDSPLFRNLLKAGKSEEERLKPTNPAAQRSLITSASTKPPDNKVLSLRPAIKIKPTPSAASSKLSLFAELEELEDLSSTCLLSPRSSNKKLHLTKPPVASSPLIPTPITIAPSTSSPQHTLHRTPPPLTFIQNPAAIVADDGPIQDSPKTSRHLSCSLNDTIKDLNIRPHVASPLESPRESRLGLKQNETDSSLTEQPTSPSPNPIIPAAPHPTGIMLTRDGYYTLPSLDQLASMKDDSGAIMVENFTVGREGYGNVVFPEKINVANLNLDEIVFFRRKEITLYPDDERKPPVGNELNRKAQITLDCVWPSDKNTRLPITEPERLRAMNYPEKLEQATSKLGAKFVEYRPETGSWVFTVKHFSKYGLVDDSDDEETATKLPPPINESTQTNGLAPLPPPPPFKELTTALDQTFGEGAEEVLYPSTEPISFDVEMLTPSLLIKTSEKIEQMKFLFEEDQDLDVDPQMEMSRMPVRAAEALALPRTVVSPPRSPVFEPEPQGPLIPTKRLLLRPFSKSKLAQRTHLFQDASLFMGRSFHVGHDLNFRITCPGLVPADDTVYPFSYHLPRGHLLKNHSVVCIKTPPFYHKFLDAPGSMKEMVTQLLQHQLSHSIRSLEPDGTPHYVPAPGTSSFAKYVDLAEKYCSSLGHQDLDLGFARQFSTALRLVQALWGELPGGDNSQGPYADNLKRREALTQWLVESTRHQLDDQFQNSAFDTNIGDSSDVFNYLTCYQLGKAMAAAQRNQDYRLSMLVVSHRGISKAALQNQLIAWRDFKADQFMEKSRLKVYAMLAGKLVWITSRGDINCCENLDWKRAFAVHLWYSCPSNDDITAAVKAYKEAFQPSDPNAEPYAVPPYPPYIEESRAEVLPGLEARHQDVCYHLLQLYCGKGRLESLLCPTTGVASEVDVRLSWVLLQLLRGLGLVPAVPAADSLHMDWAAQLEMLGLWPWAAFSLLHLSQPAHRRAAVLELLARHAALQPDSHLRRFLCEDLGIPPSWLAHAQAIRARYEGRTELEAKFLQEAGQLTESHHLVVTSLAADLIVNERHRDLQAFLEPLASAGSIPGWSSGGKLLLDWLDMVELLEGLSHQGLESMNLERLEPQVVDVAMKVCAYTHSCSPKERLCQCMMAQKAFLLLQMVIRCQALSGGTPAGTSLLRLLQEALLPEDYALQQLQSLVRTYMLQFVH